MDETHMSREVSPRAHANLYNTQTVRRGLRIIQVFDEWSEKDGFKDWRDIDPKDLRNALDAGDTFDPTQAIWPELWDRYTSRELHRQVLDLVENVPMDKLSKKVRKEINDGISRISR